MAEVDSLVSFRDAALACNDAAKNALALLQWTNSRQGEPFNAFAIPFPRGQTLPGRPGEPLKEAVRRGAAATWTGELQKALDGWSAAVGQCNCLEQIKQAVVSLRVPPLSIGIDSFATAHEAAQRRASELLYYLQGRMSALSDEVKVDLRGRIEQEYQAADSLAKWCDAQPTAGTTLIDQGSGDDDRNFRHSPDFRSVVWLGTSYTFTKSQAACVKVLWAAWEAETPELDGLTVVTQAEVAQTRLIDVFRSKGKADPAWGTMIVRGESKGAYRLSDGTTATPPKPRRKQSRKTTRKTHR